VDTEFDKLLDSLARVAHKQAKLVIDAVSRWKKGQSSNEAARGQSHNAQTNETRKKRDVRLSGQ
jgi:hypothetical protein